MRSTPPRRVRRRVTATSALVAAASMVVLGMQAIPAAATPTPTPKGDPGQLPAQVSSKEYKALIGHAKAQRDETASRLNLGSKVELKVKSVIENRDGTTHTHYVRTYEGLPVIGGDIIVHRAPSGEIQRVTKGNIHRLKVNTTPESLKSTKPDTPTAKGSQAPHKVVWMGDGAPVLAWETVIGGKQDNGAPNRLHVITNAVTGKKIIQWQGVQTATGHSMYSGTVQVNSVSSGGRYLLRDNERGGHDTTNLNHRTSGRGTLFSDRDNVWGNGSASSPQTAAVDAAYGAGMTWDFYKAVFGRVGIRGDGVGAYSRVHYGNGYVNAFWQDSCFCMTYGDGRGNRNPLTELDVAGHEMTHGVTSASAGLIYKRESGGLNEATSDIMATAMEFWAQNPSDRGDYLIGEKLNISGRGPLRYMARPNRDGSSLNHWSPRAGSVDVHYSSGIANHFFYLLSEGSGSKVINGVSYNSPTYDNQPVKGIGRAKATAIWYKALTEEFLPRTDYADARRATLEAAAGLYGRSSVEWAWVANAWAAVNVGSRVDVPGDGDGDDPPDDPGGTWAPGTAYSVDDVVTYNGQEYRCLQAHTSMPGWTPDVVPALWQPV